MPSARNAGATSASISSPGPPVLAQRQGAARVRRPAARIPATAAKRRGRAGGRRYSRRHPCSLQPLAPYGWSDRWAALLADHPGCDPARVVRHDGSGLLLATTDGIVAAPLTRRLDPAPDRRRLDRLRGRRAGRGAGALVAADPACGRGRLQPGARRERGPRAAGLRARPAGEGRAGSSGRRPWRGTPAPRRSWCSPRRCAASRPRRRPTRWSRELAGVEPGAARCS